MTYKNNFPKITSLLCTYAFTYVLFLAGLFDVLPNLLHGYGYLTMFAGGLLFSFGFTTPFAIAIFIEMAATVNPVLGAAIAGIGAMTSDLLIFKFIRFSFMDEIEQLKKIQPLRWFRRMEKDTVPTQIQKYIAWSIAGIILASPFPDELGVSVLSGDAHIHGKPFAAFCFTMNTLGVLLVLLGATSIS